LPTAQTNLFLKKSPTRHNKYLRNYCRKPIIKPNQYCVIWWTLRTATSSVGNYEAGWALSAVSKAAEKSGLGTNKQQKIVEQALFARMI